MMTIQEITAWAQTPENENHPKYANIMSELALIELLKTKLHDHEGVETLRRWYKLQGFVSQQMMARTMAQVLNSAINIPADGSDPGDEFFVQMKDAMKKMIREKMAGGPEGIVLNDEGTMVCVHDAMVYGKIDLARQACTFWIHEFGWEKMRSHEVADALINIRTSLMKLFEDSVNWEFRIKGSPLVDVVAGVDWNNMTVKGRMYGDFAVDLCELRGKVRSQHDQLN